MLKQTIAIDLDGVINNYSYYTKEIPEPKKGAKEFIKELYSLNYNLILYTNRNPKIATEWLIKNKLDKYFTEVTNIKPMAYLYIDDRAVNFSGNYAETLKQIKNFKPYWQN